MEKKKILFVEDCRDSAFLIIEELELKNAEEEVLLFKDGQEAMDYLKQTDEVCKTIRSRIGMVLLDLNLPKIDGMSVLKFLKNNPMYRSIPVIILTTSSDQKTIDEAYKNGANGFLTKSLFFEEKFAKELILLREYFESILMKDPIAGTNTRIDFTVKFRGLPDDIIKRAGKVTDTEREISNESLKQSGENNDY